MKPLNHQIWFATAMLVIVSLACSATAPEPTATVAPTSTAIPTATQRPTSTPRPTLMPSPPKSPMPPTATAVPMKLPAINKQYEVKVLSTRILDTISTDYFIYSPNAGDTFLQLAVVVKNLKPGSRINVNWENVYIIDKNNRAWYPNFAGSYTPKNSNEQVNPATLFFDELSNLENIFFEDTVYLRVIWAVVNAKPRNYLFGFDTSPLIEIKID